MKYAKGAMKAFKVYRKGFSHGRKFKRNTDTTLAVATSGLTFGGAGFAAGTIGTRGRRKREQSQAFAIGFEMGKKSKK